MYKFYYAKSLGSYVPGLLNGIEEGKGNPLALADYLMEGDFPTVGHIVHQSTNQGNNNVEPGDSDYAKRFGTDKLFHSYPLPDNKYAIKVYMMNGDKVHSFRKDFDMKDADNIASTIHALHDEGVHSIDSRPNRPRSRFLLNNRMKQYLSPEMIQEIHNRWDNAFSDSHKLPTPSQTENNI